MSAHHAAQIPFKDRAKAALADRSLKVAIERTTGTAERKRAVAVAAFAEFEAARARGRAIKDHVIAHLDHYLEQFERNAIASGAKVHWAADDAEARAIVDRHFGADYGIPHVDLKPRQAAVGELFTARQWRQSLYSGLFWFCQVGPFFGIFTVMAPVLASLDFQGSMGADLALNGIQIAGAVFGVFMLHWMSGRGFVIWTFTIILATFLALGLFPGAPTWVVVSLFAIYMFVGPASNNIQFVYPPEIFDTHLRATGVGFSAAFSRVSAAGVTYLLPYLLQHFGFSATLIVMAAFPLLGLILSILWAPETKHKHLT